MTAQLEEDMDAIAEREKTKDVVVTHSRDLLREAYRSLEDNREQVAARIFEGITDDRILGECPKCKKNRLRVLRSKTSRKRFVGCEGYPDCDQTYPLPQRGDILAMNETCPECGSPRIKVLGGRRPWVLCLDPECPTKADYRAKRAAAAEANGSGEASTAQKAAGAGTGKRSGTSKTRATAGKSRTRAAGSSTKDGSKTRSGARSRKAAGSEG
jgi:DNA topoisomerase-1